MRKITAGCLRKASQQNRLRQRLGPLADFLLARDLSAHLDTLSRPGTCLLLYDNTASEAGGERFAGLPGGLSLPVRWVKRTGDDMEGDDPYLPPAVLKTAAEVRDALERDGDDKLSDAQAYVLKRLTMHEEYDLSAAEFLFSGGSCALPLAVGLTIVTSGRQANPGVLMSGELHEGRLSPITVGGKAHVLATCGLPNAELLVAPGSELPTRGATPAIRPLPDYINGQTLRRQMGEALRHANVEPPTGEPKAWLEFLNGPIGLLYSEQERQRRYDTHLVDYITRQHTWRGLDGEPIAAAAAVGSGRPFLTSWNPRNIPLTRLLALSYHPSRICLLAATKDSKEAVLEEAKRYSPFDALPMTVVHHAPENPDWSTTREELHTWLTEHEACNVELLPGAGIMTALLMHAAHGTSARLFIGSYPARSPDHQILYGGLTFYEFTPRHA